MRNNSISQITERSRAERMMEKCLHRQSQEQTNEPVDFCLGFTLVYNKITYDIPCYLSGYKRSFTPCVSLMDERPLSRIHRNKSKGII